MSMGSDDRPHVPVLLGEVLERLRPAARKTYIDATFGAGGYTRAVLDAATCSVCAFDRDPTAIAAGQPLVDQYDGRLRLMLAPFGSLYDLCRNDETADAFSGQFDGVVFDLGVSSMQLDQPERGFSFQADGPLDMRMFAVPGRDAAESGCSAADVVNTFEPDWIANILYRLGDERRSRAIARAIADVREDKPFSTTLQLADVVSKALGGRRGQARHPATRTFQALRMFVNDELGQLARGLCGAERCLKPGGRLVVVTFHSAEDKIVKRFFNARAGRVAGQSRHLPQVTETGPAASLEIVNHRSLTSSKGELASNPRARSARLRSGERTEASPWPLDLAELIGPAAGL